MPTMRITEARRRLWRRPHQGTQALRLSPEEQVEGRVKPAAKCAEGRVWDPLAQPAFG